MLVYVKADYFICSCLHTIFFSHFKLFLAGCSFILKSNISLKNVDFNFVSFLLSGQNTTFVIRINIITILKPQWTGHGENVKNIYHGHQGSREIAHKKNVQSFLGHPVVHTFK